MLRKLIDYKKLDHELAALLIETYPDGYGDDDIISFQNANGEYVEAVELQTSETLYLVKISKSLANFISTFDDTIERELEASSSRVLEEVESSDMDYDSNTETESEEETELD
ncbi:hypothetical protein JQC67_12555 [Aurantibacter crassamenti]|uniref:hypothetical protein n=1 Tax=Aurantibacter crassamenti TaxID=1837375 RepID=UPI0019397D57|nr:hypothetical protein [Aurantibacter crassamenti]MBM1106974.1 hypothetical protein [Aurantibacter crassamenti]